MATREENIRYKLKHKYKLTLDEHNRLVDKQSGRCAICGGRNRIGKALYVDHNHETGFIRGLLCHNCNIALGCVHDSVMTLLKMVEYLEKTRDREDMQEGQ